MMNYKVSFSTNNIFKPLKNFALTMALSFSITIILVSCATTVAIQVERPPTLNTLGIQRIAVMPFRTTDSSSLQRHAANLLTNDSLSRIQETKRFTMVNSTSIEQAQWRNQNIESLADALFSGQVLSLTINNRSEERRAKDRNGEYYYYTVYIREAGLSFNYNITKTRDGSMLGPLVKTDSTTSSNQDYSKLPSPEQMIQTLVQKNLRNLGNDIAPHIVTEHRRFEDLKSKDKILKQQVKDAMSLVKSGNYRSAQEAFQFLYQDTGRFEAGYNVALLIEIQGNLEGALAYMQQVYFQTGNPKARDGVNRIQKEIDNVGLVAIYRENQSQQDIVVAHVVEEIISRIPNKTNVAVINNSQIEKDLAETLTNRIIYSLQSKNIQIVDRSNRNLVEAERMYQVSGNVNDNEIVKIGNEAGINVFILVSVTGSGASRRLSLRCLDIERNTIIYQTPQTNDFNL
jgi:TolB-like protein